VVRAADAVHHDVAGRPAADGWLLREAVGPGAVVDAGMSWLAVVAVLFSLVGAFYYLRVIKVMYFDVPADEGPVEATFGLRSLLSVNGLLVLLLGIFPAGLHGRVLSGDPPDIGFVTRPAS